jgi:2-isopropylmalate synthase
MSESEHSATEETREGSDEPHLSRLTILDTTLRDGEQAPGASMTGEEKLSVAKQLARLGVDIIEAGFPAASQGELEAVRQIARQVTGPIITGLTRCTRSDADMTWEAIRDAERRRIHLFLATSEVHMKHKLRKTPAEIVEIARRSVEYAMGFGVEVQFSAEDATRSDPDFVCEVVCVARDAGATVLNICDTVGYSTPTEYHDLIGKVRDALGEGERLTISTHCHDDLGLAAANSLAGVLAGARQVECTINGLGERAGMAALEEIVMTLQTRMEFYGMKHGIDTREIAATSALVQQVTGIAVPPNKAVVGSNAFSHEAGIHQHGILAHPSTYEIMNPQSVGQAGSRLVLGKHSGRHAFRMRLSELGLELHEDHLNAAFALFKTLADEGDVSDEALREIAAGVLAETGRAC